MNELIVNLHVHTPYSDGHGSHQEIAQAALQTGLDAVIVTDHNVLVKGPEGYYRDGNRQVLLLVGEEVHDQAREPQNNHLLILGANQELATLASQPQRLLDGVQEAKGLAFLAHIYDYENKAFNEDDLSWVDWDLTGYTGIELWNSLSEFKTRLKSRLHAVFFAFFPTFVARGPFPASLKKWDELLSSGRKVVAVGGSDAHALRARMGPLRRVIFPYEFHFRGINTHLLPSGPLTGDVEKDKALVYGALRQGHAFIGYDLPASTRGFRFSAQGKEITAKMGDEIPAKNGVTMQVRLPFPTECRLLRNGETVKTWAGRDTCTHITAEPGVYRVEVFVRYRGARRGWIYSNPIYVRG